MGLNIAMCTIGLKSPGGNRGVSREARAFLLRFFALSIEGAGGGFIFVLLFGKLGWCHVPSPFPMIFLSVVWRS